MNFFRVDPGVGNLISFMQFSIIAIYGLIFTSKFFTVKRNIPMTDYASLVIMFFAANVINNYALSFKISIPLVMIFQSGSLMANMVLGVIILKKSYDLWKYLSVLMISVGIFLCTIASGTEIKRSTHAEKDNFFWWTIGVVMLSSALFISARLGLYQETLYKKRGKHVRFFKKKF
jgi:UDP-xylose/UDP-N-acetylglucosamine transporter B4